LRTEELGELPIIRTRQTGNVDPSDISRYTSVLTRRFAIAICDKAYKLKDPFTRSHYAVYRLHVPAAIYLTATVVMNNVDDLTSMLAMF